MAQDELNPIPHIQGRVGGRWFMVRDKLQDKFLLDESELVAIRIKLTEKDDPVLAGARNQLTKAEPLIREDERMKLLEWLEANKVEMRGLDSGEIMEGVPDYKWQTLKEKANGL